MNTFNVGQRVKYIGKKDDELPNLKPEHMGTIWSVGVGKSWIWVVFDTHERPVAVHHNEVELLTNED
jgi:hypothetical protein